MLNGNSPFNNGQPGASAVPPATTAASGWSTGVPASPLNVQAPSANPAAHADGSPLHAPGSQTFSNASSPHSSPRPPVRSTVNTVPSPTPALDASNVVHVPLTSEAATQAAHDGPISDGSATRVPTSATTTASRSAGLLSKQSSSYLNTPSFTMAAWRSGDNGSDENNNTGNANNTGGAPASVFGYSRNQSQVFDPTEVPALRHTMSITVTRDGKVVEEQLDPYEVARLYGQQQAALRSLQSRYDFLAVPEWVRLHPLLGTYLAELVGSFAWVLTLALVSVRNESIFTVADDTNMTPIPIGFMFTSMIFTFGYISSAHLNPAVSVAVFLIRQMDLSQCFVYILCQLGGAFLAGVVSMVIQGNTDIFVPSVSSSYITSGIFSELIFTFAICLVVLNIAYSRQSGNFFYGFAVGMTITAGSASVGRISGGAFNPAAATGLQVAMCIVSNCDDLKSVWIYWLAPLIGAVAAALLFSQMVQPTDTQVLEDNKVFQDITLLQKQRQQQQAAAAAAAAAGGAAAGGAAAAEEGSADSHSHTSSSASTSSSRSTTPASSSSSSSHSRQNSGEEREMHEVPYTRSPREAVVRSREELEEEEEVAGDTAADAQRSRGAAVAPAAPGEAAKSPAAPPADTWKKPVVTNNSDLDNWRKRPPPRRDDAGAAASSSETGASSWF